MCTENQTEIKSPINWKLVEQRGLDRTSLTCVLPVFIDDIKKYISQLLEAIDSNDTESVCSVAHTIKGASLNIGAEELALAAIKLEQMYKNNSLDGVPTTVTQIEISFNEIQDHFSSLEDPN